MKALWFSIIVVVLLACSSETVWAQNFGNFEQPLPWLNDPSIDNFVSPANNSTPFLKYLTYMVNFITALIVAIALIIIVIAGYTYMTAGGDGKKVETAKTMIKGALLGITLALTAFLLLNQISPQFASDLKEPTLGAP